MSKEKRVYSLNLGAYIYYRTQLAPEVKRDYELDGEIYYMVFPSEDSVKEAVVSYKDGDIEVNLHSYLNAYQFIREAIKEKRG